MGENSPNLVTLRLMKIYWTPPEKFLTFEGNKSKQGKKSEDL
jgi:hypothetical protein